MYPKSFVEMINKKLWKRLFDTLFLTHKNDFNLYFMIF